MRSFKGRQNTVSSSTHYGQHWLVLITPVAESYASLQFPTAGQAVASSVVLGKHVAVSYAMLPLMEDAFRLHCA